MASRDYPTDNADEPQDGPKFSRPREHGVTNPTAVPLLQRLLTFTRFTLSALTLLYCVALLAILYGLEYNAESHPFLSTGMYLPPWGWLCPLALLAPPSLIFYARLLLPQVVCIPVVVFGFMDVRWHGPHDTTGVKIKVVTNNIGQAKDLGFKPFAVQQDADIIALQDAWSRYGPQFAEAFPGRYIVVKDQFTLISKFPIRAADAFPWPDPLDPRQRVAAWFEVEVKGQPLLVFVVHMPTPRDQINAMKGLGAFSALLGREGGHGDTVRDENTKFFKNQLNLAQKIVGAARTAKVPFIVCGDFNVPTHGKAYRLYRDNWVEAFNERGHGVGATFPGGAKIPAWLRLDNIYCSKLGLRPLHAEVEGNRSGQHLCMAATFELLDNKRK
jgi:endonuclease/exonuclease/phosphatase family metal-dependent hydrolase